MPRPMQRHRDEGLASWIDLGCGEHSRHAGRTDGRGGVDREDFSVRVRTAHERRVQHAGQLNVVDIASMAAE